MSSGLHRSLNIGPGASTGRRWPTAGFRWGHVHNGEPVPAVWHDRGQTHAVHAVETSTNQSTADAVLRTGTAVEVYGAGRVRAQLAAGRWQRPLRGVVVTHNGPLTEDQRRLVALHGAAPGTVFGGLTALALDGFTGFEEDEVHLVLPEGVGRPTAPWVVPHWSTVLDPRDVHPWRCPPRTRTARSLVDAASWQRHPRRARAIVLAGVQQRLTSTRHLRDALSRRGPCRHRRLITESILDSAGGIQSLPERDVEQIRRRFHLPEPSRQSPVRRRDGRYFLDLEWRQYDVGAEIHGIPHLQVVQWESDLERANEIVIEGPRLLIFSSYATRHESDRVGHQLVRLLRRGGWTG